MATPLTRTKGALGSRWGESALSGGPFCDGFPPALVCLLTYVTLHAVLFQFLFNSLSATSLDSVARWPSLFGIPLGVLAVITNALFIVWIALDLALPLYPCRSRPRNAWRGCYLLGLLLLLGVQLYLDSWRTTIAYYLSK